MTSSRNKTYYHILFALFFVSGFCGLIYQVVWLRMAFATFGVITPILSVVISVFMLGLGLGSWLGGKYIERLSNTTGQQPILLYAVAEFFIGTGGMVIPLIFSASQELLLRAGNLDSFRYLVLSAILLGISLFPFCLFMGTTFPFVAAFIKRFDKPQKTSFSYLYLANVLGAMAGVIAAAYFLIELYGLRGTLHLAVFGNFFIALVSIALHRHYLWHVSEAPVEEKLPAPSIGTEKVIRKSGIYLSILFMTGFVSMGMEVVWTRAFTPVLSTTIYAFASILAVYFLATWTGSWLYRRHNQTQNSIEVPFLIAGLAVFSLLPEVFADPRLPVSFSMKAAAVRLSIFPFCCLLGYLTPKLIDEICAGEPATMGRVYAINIIGCIFGPLFAAYVLLPAVGVRFALIILSAPFFAYYGYYFKSAWMRNRRITASAALLSGIIFVCSARVLISYEDAAFFFPAVVRRDYAATVISYGSGMRKVLLVNGIGITRLTPVTKMMAHVPLAIRENKPTSICVICLGMGTSFRSAASWDIDTTAVELVPSVKDAFGFYFEDAEEILRKPNARIIVDDGRRFLMRTQKKFDVVTLDPSPPITSSFSSLLYSQDFYRIVKTRLEEGGILAQWFPAADTIEVLAVARSIAAEFPYVAAYSSIEGWGVHFFASNQYFEMPDIETFVARLPERAKEDLVEWNKDRTPQELYGIMLQREIPLKALLLPNFKFSITDDRPFNEYFYVRDILRNWAIETGGVLIKQER